ncbi:hypothetical protein D3C80_1644540 [compost metagenome]
MFFASMHLQNVSKDDEDDEKRMLTNEEEAFIELRKYVLDSNSKLKQQIIEAANYFNNPPIISNLKHSEVEKAKKLKEPLEMIRKDTRLNERLLMEKELYYMLKYISFDDNLSDNAFGEKMY